MLNQMTHLRNIEMQISYRGSAYFGWQIQPDVPTVQRCMQVVLRRSLDQPSLRVFGASRTDTGVHAHDQRVGFTTTNPIPLSGLRKTLNHQLPEDIRVLTLREREPEFSVRYGARGKHYTYFWCNRANSGPFLNEYMTIQGSRMDVAAMNSVCRHLLGTKSFAAFQSSRDHRTNSETTLFAAKVGRIGDVVYFDVVGHHFLYHMVRNMAKSLAQVGIGVWTPERWLKHFEAGDRSKMCVTAPAKGLHLFKIFYDGDPIGFADNAVQFRQLLANGLHLAAPES